MSMWDTPTQEQLMAAYKREQLRLTQVRTHWDGCWRHHLLCAEQKVEQLEKRIAELEADLVTAGKAILSSGCDLNTSQKRAAELEDELRHIVNANPREWGEQSSDFELWAKSRARYALEKGGAK